MAGPLAPSTPCRRRAKYKTGRAVRTTLISASASLGLTSSSCRAIFHLHGLLCVVVRGAARAHPERERERQRSPLCWMIRQVCGCCCFGFGPPSARALGHHYSFDRAQKKKQAKVRYVCVPVPWSRYKLSFIFLSPPPALDTNLRYCAIFQVMFGREAKYQRKAETCFTM